MRFLLFILVFACVALGCSVSPSINAKKLSTRPSYETCYISPSEDMAAAKSLNKEAVCAIKNDNLPKAEKLLKKALTIDPNYGTAHYNLGVVYARMDNYYLAAWEFDKAMEKSGFECQARSQDNLTAICNLLAQSDIDRLCEEVQLPVLHVSENEKNVGGTSTDANESTQYFHPPMVQSYPLLQTMAPSPPPLLSQPKLSP